MSAQGLARGFADPARESQRAFKALMWAMARPGLPETFVSHLTPPAPLTPELAALALTLLDYETTVWLDAPLAQQTAVVEFLRFHTSARIVSAPQEAQFALISNASDLPDFTAFAQGEPDYPDRSTTLIVAVQRLAEAPFQIEGPGIKGHVGFGAEPLPADMSTRLAANRALFPLGLDLVLAAPGAILGLPRSVRLIEEA
ncbi:phosphonate C-P lyase system protein PhnH [Aquabacter sp. CN5-332]|uniref:phosphonate C-P lyase system protein PhnH n=1 Tax=Aquabacter sp. CN5-332 TaxID=3156608 RepID=UPI0032B33978